MTEEEYLSYLLAVERLSRREAKVSELQEPLRDERGDYVPGCSHTLPAPTDS